MWKDELENDICVLISFCRKFSGAIGDQWPGQFSLEYFRSISSRSILGWAIGLVKNGEDLSDGINLNFEKGY